MRIENIIWETDGLEPEELGLPSEVELPENIDLDDDYAINDYLSDTYGRLVIDWFKRCRYEVYDSNDEIVETFNDLESAQEFYDNNGYKFIFDAETSKVVGGSIDD